MINVLTKIKSAAHNRTSYRVGLLQAKAYRVLKQKTMVVLTPLGISTIEWALLGLLADRKSLRMSHVAQELGVEAPFITAMVLQLKKKNFIVLTKDINDSRVKSMSLTTEGNTFVTETEPIVRGAMRPIISGVSITDLLGYLSVLEQIVHNDSNSR